MARVRKRWKVAAVQMTSTDDVARNLRKAERLIRGAAAGVVAPAQVGHHGRRRRSHGETTVIDPWGTVVSRLPRRRGWIQAEIDLTAQSTIRKNLPCLTHTRRIPDA